MKRVALHQLMMLLIGLSSVQALMDNCYFTDDAYGRVSWSLVPHENDASYAFRFRAESLEDFCLGAFVSIPDDDVKVNFTDTTANVFKDEDGHPKAKYFLHCYLELSFGNDRFFRPYIFQDDMNSLEEKPTHFHSVLNQSSTWSIKPVPLYTQFSFDLRETYLNVSIPSDAVFSFFVLPWSYFTVQNYERQYYYVKLFNDNGVPNRVWHPECDAPYFRTRTVYYIWKIGAFSLNAALCILSLAGLIVIRKKYYVRSRSIVPYVSCVLLLLHNIVNIILSALYAEPTYDNLIMNSVIIVVFSVQIAQIIRYFICRLVYATVSRKKVNPLWFRMLFSKFTPIISVIVIVIVEGALFAIVTTTTFNSDFYFTLMDNVVVALFVLMFLIAVVGIIVYIIQNRKTLKLLGSPFNIVKWYFYYDDTFRYHGELFVIVLTLLSGLIFWILSMINGSYLSNKPMLPVSSMNLRHMIGYALYGLSKIVFDTLLVGFEPVYLIFMSLLETNNSDKQNINDKELLNDMDVFLASVIGDTNCLDLMRKYLITEFRAELLDLYLYIKKNTKVDPETLSKEFPFLQVELVFEGENIYQRNMDLEVWSNTFCDLVKRNMISAFCRFQQTTVFKKEYIEQKNKESEFVLKQIR